MSHEVIFNDQKLISLLDQIMELFYKFGIRNVNMDDISHHLKISKKTLYQSFKNKEDLIEKIFLYDSYKWINKIAGIDPDRMNAIDIIIHVSTMVYEEMSRLDPKIKFEMMKYYEPLFNKYSLQKQEHIYNYIIKNLLKGKSEGLYREDVDNELTATLYLKNLVEMHRIDYCFSNEISFDKIFEVMFENHIRAISTNEGIQYFEKRKSELTQLQKSNN
jgi:AcrR family transcriptional regulator